jgi:parvulin-like peptidyl-prolyl isomerase
LIRGRQTTQPIDSKLILNKLSGIPLPILVVKAGSLTSSDLMSDVFSIFPNDVIQEVKCSLHLSEVVESIVRRQAIDHATKQLKIQVKPDELQSAADKFRLKNGLSSADATFEWLQQNALSIEEFELFIYAEVLATKLSQHLFDQQVESYFIDHKPHYRQAELSEMILPEPDLAFDVFEAIQAGQVSFDQALCRYLSDSTLSEVRGYRGKVGRSSLDPAIAKVVFTATPPQVLSPIVLDDQTHLIYVHQLIEPQLDQALSQQIRSELLTQWLQQQIDQAEIHIKL